MPRHALIPHDCRLLWVGPVGQRLPRATCTPHYWRVPQLVRRLLAGGDQ